MSKFCDIVTEFDLFLYCSPNIHFYPAYLGDITVEFEEFFGGLGLTDGLFKVNNIF